MRLIVIHNTVFSNGGTTNSVGLTKKVSFYALYLFFVLNLPDLITTFIVSQIMHLVYIWSKSVI